MSSPRPACCTRHRTPSHPFLSPTHPTPTPTPPHPPRQSLNALAAKYASQGLSILGYPCNQFGGQEPGDGLEILHCVQCVRPGNGFDPAFPLTVKIDVNGVLEDGTWKDMKAVCPAPWNAPSGDVAWNFETVLFAKSGIPYRRYATGVNPADMAGDVEYLLSQ